jgi:hypothetical protein
MPSIYFQTTSQAAVWVACVTVLEAATVINEVGAGIQLSRGAD